MKKSKKITGGIAAVIITVAISLIGVKEKPNNSGFVVPSVEQAMREVGWHKYDSWCVYFAKLCWYRALSPFDTVEYNRLSVTRDLAMKLISGNSQSTLANFQKYISTTLDKPVRFVVSDSAVVGSICIWQHYKNGVAEWSGHAGIVDSVFPPGYKWDYHTIEGNTNNNGSSNGDRVLPKYRRYNWTAINGLRNKKFIVINYSRYKP
jgi:hypothetical protein